MGIKERKKEMLKLKILSFFAVLFLSLYLFDKGDVNYIKNGALLFSISSALYVLLKINKYYILTGEKISMQTKDHFILFKQAYSVSEKYNDILSIMMLLMWLISLCLVIFGVYLKISNFFAI